MGNGVHKMKLLNDQKKSTLSFRPKDKEGTWSKHLISCTAKKVNAKQKKTILKDQYYYNCLKFHWSYDDIKES